MTPNLAKALRIYSMGSDDFCARMASDYNKPDLVGLLSVLLTLYINDRNSSTLREFLTVSIAGYEHSEAKIGYNGFKTIGAGKTVGCEVKPKNVRRQDLEDYRAGRRPSPPAKLNGGGNFTDYTWARLEKDKKAAPNMLVSGFADGRLLYVLEFPFNTRAFLERLENRLRRKFPDGDVSGLYLRSADFDYSHHIDEATLVYRAADLEPFAEFFNRKFHARLTAMPAPPEVRE